MTENKLVIFANNAAGISSKMKSFINTIETVKASIFILQETHLKKKGKFKNFRKLSDFVVFELVRTEKEKGGLAIGVKDSFNPVLISEGC